MTSRRDRYYWLREMIPVKCGRARQMTARDCWAWAKQSMQYACPWVRKADGTIEFNVSPTFRIITSRIAPRSEGTWVLQSGSVYAKNAVEGRKNFHGSEYLIGTLIPIAHMDREPGNGTFPVERDN